LYIQGFIFGVNTGYSTLIFFSYRGTLLSHFFRTIECAKLHQTGGIVMRMLHLFAAAIAIGFATSCAYPDLTPDECRIVCFELGLTPESMTALGLTSSDASALMNRVADSETIILQLRTLQQQQTNTLAALRDARKSIRVAETNSLADQIESEIASLELQSESLTNQIELIQDQIRAFALGSTVDLTLAERVCEPTGLAVAIPPEYRVVVLTDNDYAEFLPALAAEYSASASGEQLDTDTQLILSRYQNLPGVVAARSHMLMHIDAVRSVFNQ
tara:strand:- start:240717 stop:241535 length:819 start_codon:yes stop_codon:yes gene_type:complete